MATVGVVGIGKLGMPISVCLSARHKVLCYDKNPKLMRKCIWPYQEQGPDIGLSFQAELDRATLEFVPLEQLVKRAEIIFVAVQTPHRYEFEGVTCLGDERSDFDYTYLKEAITEITQYTKSDQVVAIISTVLPGTIRREILPITKGKCKIAYNPSFVAMGTVQIDFLSPEFILIGGEDEAALDRLHEFYHSFFFGKRPIMRMSLESAELTKVSYNTMISSRVATSNIIMEIASKIPGCNCDDVVSALSRANKRLMSPAYLRGGMGDGGSCLEFSTSILTTDGWFSIGDLVGKQNVKIFTQNKKDKNYAITANAINIRKTGDNKHLVRVRFDNDTWVDCTPDHRFDASFWNLQESAEVEAKDLQVGIAVRALQNGYAINRYVRSVEPLPGLHDVYCMEVPNVGWFCANGVLVHNCHPRDNIAMSWLSRQLNLSHDIFYDAMKAREDQTKWLADVIQEQMQKHPNLPLVILGSAFKAETNIVAGSPSILLQNILRDRGVEFGVFDPYVHKNRVISGEPRLYFIATKHTYFTECKFVPGTVVIDPHRYVPQREGVEIIYIGIGKEV